MSIFQMPVQSAWGQNIKASAGAKLYFYEPGTVIPKTTYSDFLETIPQTHPVVADANGRFPVIYFSGGYKVALKDANDVQQWTADNVFLTSESVNFLGDFDASTNGGDYPASGNKGDLYIVSTSFKLNAASGSHYLFEGDFILANKDNAIGVDADWDTIKGTKKWLDEDDMFSNSNVLAPSQQSVVAHTGVSNWFSTITYAIGDTVRASDFKLYKAKTINTNQTPVGDLVNWEPANIIDNLITNDPTQALSAAQGKILQDQLFPATRTVRGLSFLPSPRIKIVNNSGDPNDSIDFIGSRFVFSDGSGEAIAPNLTKKLSSIFAVGNNQGGLDVLPKAINQTYHCYAVYNPTTDVKDYAFSINSAGPVLAGNLAGFTKSTRIWSILTDASNNIRGFQQIGNICFWNSPISIYSNTGAQPIIRTLLATPSPAGISCLVTIKVFLTKASGTGATDTSLVFTNPNQPDIAPTIGGNAIFDMRFAEPSVPTEDTDNTFAKCPTNLSSQIGFRFGPGVPVLSVQFNIRSWEDPNL